MGKKLDGLTVPSTISGFQRKYAIPVVRKLVTVPGYARSKVTVARYWLTPDAQNAAAQLLEQEGAI